jgi:UDP-N-acetylglucosamine 2-epimerase (non-hydrolysing)
VRVVSVVGARPNFMKLAPVDRALRRHAAVEHVIVHTGQHYDREMSDSFFDDLGIPEPQHNLGVGSGTHAQQTAEVMLRLEPLLQELRPELLLVYGDVNSTVAATLVAVKLSIRVGHVEAGLRSGDWSMPEEINRVVTDRLASMLFTPSRDADANLKMEGVASERIHFVGNVMMDSLVYALERAKKLAAAARYHVPERGYVLVTLHRPSNVDDQETLRELLGGLDEIGRSHPVLFPVHPRTRQRIAEFGLGSGERSSMTPLTTHPSPLTDQRGLRLLQPVGYIEMLSLLSSAGLVITDSGGLQEESTFLGVPCLTVRPNTERPITITQGTNQLVPSTRRDLVRAFEGAWGTTRNGCTIEYWDGHAAERIARAILQT